MNEKTNPHLGKKILYAIVILMSGLLILLSVASILGVWLVEQSLSDTAVAMLRLVEESTVTVRAGTERIDQAVQKLQEVTTQVQDASQQLSQNVSDKGLLMVLLPEEQEQSLMEAAGSVKETFNNIRETIANALVLYQSIDRLPFVNLPGLDENQLDSLSTSVENTQTLAADLRQGVTDFRSGVSGKVDRITSTAGQLDSEISQVRDRLSQLDARLAALAALSVRLQQVIPGLLMALAIILSLILVFLIFTQVEVIRLYVNRWRLLREPEVPPAQETLAQPAQ